MFYIRLILIVWLEIDDISYIAIVSTNIIEFLSKYFIDSESTRPLRKFFHIVFNYLIGLWE